MSQLERLNMAEEVYSLDSCKLDVRRYFARLYSALKARELQTVRQIEVVWKEGERQNIKYKCVEELNVSFDNEARLFDEIQKFGVLDFEKLNVDSELFIMEDYDTVGDEHMYCYKWLESEERSVEREAFDVVTNNRHCVCLVSCSPDDIHRKFSQEIDGVSPGEDCGGLGTDADSGNERSESENSISNDVSEKGSREYLVITNGCDLAKMSVEEITKPDPTQDWLNHIKGETETEPSQVVDLMEHSAIECS